MVKATIYDNRVPPHIDYYTHKIKYLELETMANNEKFAAEIVLARLRSNSEVVRKLENEMFRNRNRNNRVIEFLRRDFYYKWHIWRALLPISVITGARPDELLSDNSKRRVARPRHVWLWLTKSTSDIPYARMAQLVGRDNSTVRKSCELVSRQLDSGGGDLVTILNDVMVFEHERVA